MPTSRTPPLERATPESQGVDSNGVHLFVNRVEYAIHEVHSFMLLRHGKVIAEGWWPPYGRDRRHMLYSLSKSFTSTAVGLAVAEGRFSIDDSVVSFFPDDVPAQVSENLAAMRVHHLLAMSTGQVEDTWPHMLGHTNRTWIQSFFKVPVECEPGTNFLYNTGASYMLSAIVQKATGLKLVDYLTPRLFKPLGIKNALWEESPQGINLGGIGLRITTEGIARFGQLYLQKGRWGDQQILPEAWIEAATSLQTPNGDSPESDWAQGYGYQFWRCRHNAYRGDGVFGQFCVVMPDQDAVLAITGGTYIFDAQQELDMVWDILLPAMADDPVVEEGSFEAYEVLTTKLAGLQMPPVDGARTSPLAASVSGKTYMLDANELNIETIGFTMMDSDAPTVTVQTAGKAAASILCGYNEWCAGEGYVPNSPLDTVSEPLAASGAWTANDAFTLVVRLYETPFYHTFGFYFDGADLMVETWVNVSFDAPQTMLLTGRVG